MNNQSSSSSYSSNHSSPLLRTLLSIDTASTIYSHLDRKEIIGCESLSSIIAIRLSKDDKINRLTRFFRYDPHRSLIKNNNDKRSFDNTRYPLAISYSLWSKDPSRYSFISALYDVDKIDKRFSSAENIKSIELSHYFNGSIPSHSLPPLLQRLFIGLHYNQPFEKHSLPSSLLSLEFDVGCYFNHPLSPSILPSSLIKLILSRGFNQRFEKGSLPPSILYIQFGGDYNQIIDDEILPPYLESLIFLCGRYNHPLPSLPSTLIQLELSSKYNHPLPTNIAALLPRLKILRLGSDFNHPLSVDVFPPLLEQLSIGRAFNHPLPITIFADNKELKILRLSDSYNHPLPILPPLLEKLYIGYKFNRPIPSGIIPSSLIIFYMDSGNGDFNHPLPVDLFPADSKLTKLKLSSSFNDTLSVGVFPPTLEELSMGDDYNHPIPIGLFPTNSQLKILSLSYYFNHPLSVGVFPSLLQELYVGPKFNHPLPVGVFPSSLRKLFLGRAFNQNIDAGVLNEGLKELEIANRDYLQQYKLVKGENLPSTIIKYPQINEYGDEEEEEEEED